MARKVTTDWDALETGAGPSADDFLGPSKPRKGGKSVSPARWKKVREEVEAMNEVGGEAGWKEATPLHFLAMLEDLHEDVYGVPVAHTGRDRAKASGALAGFMKRQLGVDSAVMYRFLIWAWDREKKTEVWRRENGREGARLTWERVVTGGPLTDYRVALSRGKFRTA